MTTYTQPPQSGQPPQHVQSTPHSYTPQPSVHPLSIVSLIFGVLGIIFLPCCIGFDGVFGLTAVITGHIGMHLIGKSGGMRTGKGLAIGGLVTGYIGVAINLGMIALMVFGASDGNMSLWDSIREDGLEGLFEEEGSEFQEADDKLEWLNDDQVDGNSEEAKEMARELQVAISTEEESFAVYCELREGRCAFLISNHHLSGREEDAFTDQSWNAAQKVCQQQGIEEGSELAVGIRDIIRYDRVVWGRVADDSNTDTLDGVDGRVQRTNNPSKIYHFFQDTGP